MYWGKCHIDLYVAKEWQLLIETIMTKQLMGNNVYLMMCTAYAYTECHVELYDLYICVNEWHIDCQMLCSDAAIVW